MFHHLRVVALGHHLVHLTRHDRDRRVLVHDHESVYSRETHHGIHNHDHWMLSQTCLDLLVPSSVWV
jgi:hypothetical protein